MKKVRISVDATLGEVESQVFFESPDTEITTRQDGDLANVYIGSECVAIMERRPYSGTWFYNPSTPERFSPAYFPTFKKTIRAAAKVAARHGLARRDLERG